MLADMYLLNCSKWLQIVLRAMQTLGFLIIFFKKFCLMQGLKFTLPGLTSFLPDNLFWLKESYIQACVVRVDVRFKMNPLHKFFFATLFRAYLTVANLARQSFIQYFSNYEKRCIDSGLKSVKLLYISVVSCCKCFG